MSQPSKFHPVGRKPHPRDWSAAEEQALTTLYPAAPWPEILAALPLRTPTGIMRKANQMDVVRDVRCTSWTEAERAVLRAEYPTKGPGAVAELLGRNTQQVKAQASFLGVRFQPHPPKPKAEPAPKALRPAARAVLRKAPAVKATPKALPPVGRHSDKASTPNANAQKAARLVRENEKMQRPLVTAEMLRKLPGGHPARMAYTRAVRNGAEAGAEAFYAALKPAA